MPLRRVVICPGDFSHCTYFAGEQAPTVFGDSPVAYDDSQQRPSFITHRLPNPNTSISTGVLRMTVSTCASVSTRGNTARRTPNSRWAKLTAS
jgi:hypothetical protein